MTEIEIEILTQEGSAEDNMLRDMQKNEEQSPVSIGPLRFRRVFVTSMERMEPDHRMKPARYRFNLSGVE